MVPHWGSLNSKVVLAVGTVRAKSQPESKTLSSISSHVGSSEVRVEPFSSFGQAIAMHEQQHEDPSLLPSASPHSNPSTPNATKLARKMSESFKTAKLKPVLPLSLHFHQLSYSAPNGVCLLRGVSGGAEAGSLLAVMGACGAGKSSLLNLLAGHTLPKRTVEGFGGKIYANGRVQERSLVRSGLACYVMQDDCLLEGLTVREVHQVTPGTHSPTHSLSSHLCICGLVAML